jgi:mannose-6-phosphate isomerase-like protein (cupin superfamily)
MAGFVVSEDAVESETVAGDTAAVRVTIDSSSGCERLVQRVLRFGPGRSQPRALEGIQEVLYVASGTGRLHVGGQAYELEPDTAAYVTAGERFEIETEGPDELVLVVVSAPQEDGSARASERRTVRYADRPVLPAGEDREFRYLVDQELGSLDVTQFGGVIPPGKAPLHSHTYDEVIYILEGEGTLHLGGGETPIARGSCIHLPPLVEHCLENTGERPMRVLGVFHPSGDPASRAYEANS